MKKCVFAGQWMSTMCLSCVTNHKRWINLEKVVKSGSHLRQHYYVILLNEIQQMRDQNKLH